MKAIDLLKGYLSSTGYVDESYLQSRDFFHKLLKEEAHNDEMLQHGSYYIFALLKQGLEKRAFPIFRDCIKSDHSFSLKEAEQTSELCRAAYNSMNYHLLLSAADAFITRHPDHRLTPEVKSSLKLIETLEAHSIG